MRILVTGGAGFIGSHTTDRLVAQGHNVIVLDALTTPVHRDGKPNYLTPGAELFIGDVRNRDLMANLLRRVDAVYHLAAYQDYLPDFARFTDVNVTSTALIYEIAVAERLELSRVVVASSQAAMGEGLYRCEEHGEQTPDSRPEAALEQSRWHLTCPVCGGPLQMQLTPERISNPQNAYGMSKLGEEMVAIQLGRRYGIPTVAMRYSIVQGPRQSVYNAYSGAEFSTCTTCWAALQRFSRTDWRSGITSTSTTSWTRTSWCSPKTGLPGGCSTSAAASGTPPWSSLKSSDGTTVPNWRRRSLASTGSATHGTSNPTSTL
jgi:nucleoside-diphosphate-sugar epimerase